MMINTKVRYALRALLEMAENADEGGVLQKDIAASQNISVKYLDHIIAELKTAGLIAGLGGRKGYVLTRDPKEITVYDVFRAVQPELFIVECLSPSVVCDRAAACPVRVYWDSLNRTIIDHMRSATLASMLKQEK